MMEKWVQVWGQTHSALSHFYYPSCKKTFRTVICSAISGKELRIEICNNPGKSDVEIGGITVAKCSKDGTFFNGEYKEISVNGKNSFTLKKNETVITEPIDFPICVDEYFCISIYVVKGDLCSGNLIDNVSLITIKGDYTKISHADNEPRVRDSVRSAASSLLRMCFHKPIPLISTVELLNDESAASIVVFGDSISQQGFWTNALEKRIRESFKGKYAVINRSVMGNRILKDFSKRFPCPGLFGISALNRFERDVLRFPDAEYVIFALGTNDFLQYGTLSAPYSEKPTPEAVFNAVCEMSQKAQSLGKKFIVLNVLRFGHAIDSKPEKIDMLLKYNQMLEDNRNCFTMVYDQASHCIDEDNPDCTRLDLLGKDRLHPNSEGGQLVADNFDLTVFE